MLLLSLSLSLSFSLMFFLLLSLRAELKTSNAKGRLLRNKRKKSFFLEIWRAAPTFSPIHADTTDALTRDGDDDHDVNDDADADDE